jgi:hypothetical protein
MRQLQSNGSDDHAQANYQDADPARRHLRSHAGFSGDHGDEPVGAGNLSAPFRGPTKEMFIPAKEKFIEA